MWERGLIFHMSITNTLHSKSMAALYVLIVLPLFYFSYLDSSRNSVSFCLIIGIPFYQMVRKKAQRDGVYAIHSLLEVEGTNEGRSQVGSVAVEVRASEKVRCFMLDLSLSSDIYLPYVFSTTTRKNTLLSLSNHHAGRRWREILSSPYESPSLR